ncbi:hypothetical protein [Candidatus Kryptobacter tengchongensis]|nr:hypothetical protein [Candidatus Kryptobacter tengchongensis]
MPHGLAKRLISSNQQSENLTLKDVLKRLAKYLHNEYKNLGKTKLD